MFRWEFHSEDGNVGFSVTRKSGDLNENMVKVVPYSKVDCHVSPIQGDILCEESGLCNFCIYSKRKFHLNIIEFKKKNRYPQL